jgi:hypothetical protein
MNLHGIRVGTDLITKGGSIVRVARDGYPVDRRKTTYLTIIETDISPKRNVGMDYRVFTDDGTHVGDAWQWHVKGPFVFTECPY